MPEAKVTSVNNVLSHTRLILMTRYFRRVWQMTKDSPLQWSDVYIIIYLISLKNRKTLIMSLLERADVPLLRRKLSVRWWWLNGHVAVVSLLPLMYWCFTTVVELLERQIVIFINVFISGNLVARFEYSAFFMNSWPSSVSKALHHHFHLSNTDKNHLHWRRFFSL